MQEIDFDELDRAVNSLMSDVPKTKPPKEETTKTLDIKPTLSEGARPDFDNITVPAKVQDTPKPAEKITPDPVVPSPDSTTAKPVVPKPSSMPIPSRPAVALRRGGRFMDVVHPSSDMKNTSTSVSRQGVKIEPRPSATPLDGALSEAAQKQEVLAKDLASSAANEWPDPLEMVDQQEVKSSSKDTSQTEKPEKPEVADSDLTQFTPFISDAKVKKRPLGGTLTSMSNDTKQEEPDRAPPPGVTDDSATVDDPNAQLPAKPEEVEQPLPAELQSDLVAIESGEHMEQLEAPDEPVVEPKKESASSTPATKPAPSEPATPAPSGPVSIAQQYKEEPSTSATTTGSIYDTDTYHQPLTHPAKKKSGWMIVVWIVLILLVGAGAGAALYFFM